MVVTLVMIALTVNRMNRIATSEAIIAQSVSKLDMALLQFHLQSIPISAVAIDDEVEALKAEIIATAHKHHITVDKRDTQPENLFNNPQNRDRLLKVMSKQEGIKTRVS